MKSFIKENTWLTRHMSPICDHGWGNGYVVIPKEHPLHGKDYNQIHDLIPNLRVNGRLTFSNYASKIDYPEIPDNSEDSWIVGFDTSHAGDTLEMWPKEKVMEEAERLREQLEAFKI